MANCYTAESQKSPPPYAVKSTRPPICGRNRWWTCQKGAAGLLLGVITTGVSKIKSELEEAGAIYKDEELVIDGNLITSRVPEDLPVFVKAIEEALVTNPIY